MSYNVSYVECLNLDAWMYKADALRLFEKYGDIFPESCFLRDLVKGYMANKHNNVQIEEDDKFVLRNFNWSGMFSNNLDFLKEDIAPYIHGKVHVIFVWEGGDSYSGMAIKDTLAINCKVIRTLEIPKGW